jgi:magnesium chelatase family protein
VTIARAAVSLTFPSRFMLAAAMNPCPCGYFGEPMRECQLYAADDSALRIENFRALLDRVDIQIEVPSVKYKELRGPAAIEDSAAVRV